MFIFLSISSYYRAMSNESTWRYSLLCFAQVVAGSNPGIKNSYYFFFDRLKCPSKDETNNF